MLACRGALDRPPRRRRVAADQLRAAVDDHLRRVDAVEIEMRPVGLLPVGERGRGKSILPSKLIPVVDMLAERDHLRAGDRLIGDEPRQDRVRRRAVGAAFGGEQLDQDRRATGGVHDRHGVAALRERSVARAGEAERQQQHLVSHSVILVCAVSAPSGGRACG